MDNVGEMKSVVEWNTFSFAQNVVGPSGLDQIFNKRVVWMVRRKRE